jgi:hypothetical protein
LSNARRANDCSAFRRQHVARQFIDSTQKRARLEVEILVSLFEAIQFLEDRDRNGDVVLVKVLQTPRIVQDDVGVDDEQLGTCTQGFQRHAILLDGRQKLIHRARVRSGGQHTIRDTNRGSTVLRVEMTAREKFSSILNKRSRDEAREKRMLIDNCEMRIAN